ncbi:flavin-containing monooxygenase [Deinococcus psychrotolerans]|uniref:flavin-containing monooxygenase n=1 Tax=Deinococcus psychrotolerans TaxID=2489213 RepID=UPI001F153F0F|nr:NAD(P)/FAD-dependent oxidoreductase [Deinococcus psychrotolerans]
MPKSSESKIAKKSPKCLRLLSGLALIRQQRQQHTHVGVVARPDALRANRRFNLRKTADEQGLRPHIRFNTEMEEARWDEEEGLWRIRTSRGDFTTRVLISGHGPLIEPKWPDIPGMEDFEGERFHSAQWNHAVNLSGKRVAVIGTGASAIQFIPEIQPLVGQLSVFQRTPPWVMPRMDEAITPRRRELFRRYPVFQRLARQRVFLNAEVRHLGFSNPRVGALMEKFGHQHLEGRVADPELRRKLTPDYRLGCKRILVSDDDYPAIQQPNVELVTETITEIRGDEILTVDGQVRAFDVLIGGTGFNATQPPMARRIFGRGGLRLADAWDSHMEALHGTAVAGFPNFFLLVGPNTALGHNSIVYIIEAQIGYILRTLKYMDAAHLLSLEPTPEAQREYSDALQDKLRESV